MSKIGEQIQKELFSFQDKEYQKFNAKLIPSVSSEFILGVRIPELRNFAKKLWKENAEGVWEYLQDLPHHYLEENHLHAFLIEELKDISICIQEIEKFLPYIDNWATCDLFSPKILKKYPEEVYQKIQIWMHSRHIYTQRYAIGLLLSNYLEDLFQEEMLKKVAEIKTEEYYLKMMVAWYFATALAKQYDAALPYLQENKLELWVHNKTIQKAIESRRISEEKKKFLKKLKIKKQITQKNNFF